MAAYFTRAVPRPWGFYRALHDCSTADINLDLHAKPINSLANDDEDVYEVERLVFSRRGNVFQTVSNLTTSIAGWS